jgi:serine/threonine-protein kinase
MAVKTALSEATEEAEQLFFDEARVAASIDHPNVCRVYDLGEEGGVLYLAMDWIDGASLSMVISAVKEGRLDFHLAAYVVAEACAGLHAAHELHDEENRPLHVVHRDATPQNILLSVKGAIKVTDFGIVKTSNQAHQETQAGEVKGKLSYLAPEQLLGQACDRRVDVFALGAVLYLASTGRDAFRDQSAGGTLLQVLKGCPTRPSSLVPGYPEELERIVLRALATERDQRYATAEEFRQALLAFLRHSNVKVGPADVARVVHQRLGGALEQRHAKLRDAQREFDSQSAVLRASPQQAPGGTSSGPSLAGGASRPTPSALTPEPVAFDFPRTPVRSGHSLPRLAGSALVIAALAAGTLVWRSGSQAISQAAAAESHGVERGLGVRGRDLASKVEWVTVAVDAVPSGADISVDGAPPQRGPLRLTAPAGQGKTTLDVSARGYQSQSLVVSHEESRTEIVKLRPAVAQRDAAHRRSSGQSEPAARANPETPEPRTAAVAEASPPPAFSEPSPHRRAPRGIDVTDPFKE